MSEPRRRPSAQRTKPQSVHSGATALESVEGSRPTEAKGTAASSRRERFFLALAAPMPATADFSVDLNFPPAFLARAIEVTAESRLFGCKDWTATLQRLTTDSGYKHEEATNIPRDIFRQGPSSNPRPGLNIVSKATRRFLATALFPQAIIATVAGPSAWSLLAGVAAGTVVGVPLGWLCPLIVWLALIIGAFTLGWIYLVSGQARGAARHVAAIALTAADRRAAARAAPAGGDGDGDGDEDGDGGGGGSGLRGYGDRGRLSRGNALASRLAVSGDEQLPHLRPAAKKMMAIGTLSRTTAVPSPGNIQLRIQIQF